MLEVIVIHALFVSCLILCFRKWGWLDYYEATRYSWMPAAGCWCIGFWLAVLMALPVYWIAMLDLEWILFPFCCVPLIKWFAHD